MIDVSNRTCKWKDNTPQLIRNFIVDCDWIKTGKRANDRVFRSSFKLNHDWLLNVSCQQTGHARCCLRFLHKHPNHRSLVRAKPKFAAKQKHPDIQQRADLCVTALERRIILPSKKKILPIKRTMRAWCCLNRVAIETRLLRLLMPQYTERTDAPGLV